MRLSRAAAVVALSLAAAACTPTQLAWWADHMDADPDRAVSDLALLPAPSGPCEQWYWTAREAGWTHSEWDTVSWVMEGESRCNPNATGRSGEVGLMQLYRKEGLCGPGLYDPLNNLRCARLVRDREGWGAWTVWRNGT